MIRFIYLRWFAGVTFLLLIGADGVPQVRASNREPETSFQIGLSLREEVAQLLERYRLLMAERRYLEANQVARQALRLAPGSHPASCAVIISGARLKK